MLFYTFHSSNFLVGDDYEEAYSYVFDGSTFTSNLKMWNPTVPKKNQYGYDIWEGDEKDILFNYPYFSAHFMKMDIRLVSDGTSGISNVQTAKAQTRVATMLDGRTIDGSQPLHKGIYIIAGKKQVVK